ncbi:hormogonium polysaccharide biosynthesis glycosyltransferase HpsN [Argonema galeatum]|uniref:hormogonium polysaccharide biosynthesis glycosyltransferase HpsN n=1 Tax=Argonema galeatum TaxID=2942762 RepID=UPI002012E713|nr:hormogonium polysaccharide biosynthesis glycosyltransferase HpsN [Argonema galeatum]MCL1465227.1 hormogonium polysaccharide biosynthesis glycosyltransferase HpsN [Argonema galeatum A003/A1]
MNYPWISVIVPTYEREQALRDTLFDLVQQDYPNFEVVVVDQTKTHQLETQAYLEELEKAAQICWCRVDWASLPGARNYGVRRSKGEIILFIDDDVQLPSGFLAAHVRNYLERPDVGSVAGRVLDRMKLAESEEGLTIDYLPPEAMEPGIGLYYLNLVHTVKPQQVITARGCNMSFRREIFDKYGLWFDERFRGSAVREESDFCLRIRQTGYKIWYDPEAYLVHLGEETGGCHDISTRSLEYQITFYHNHFLMGFKNLTPKQMLNFSSSLFQDQVLASLASRKSKSLPKVIGRMGSYSLGFISAIASIAQSGWNDGQVYTRLEEANG